MNHVRERSLALLQTWLERSLPRPAARWLDENLQRLAASATDRAVNLAISLVSRQVGKAGLVLDADDLQAAEAARPGWQPSGWSLDQAARTALLLAVAADEARFPARLDQLCRTADVGELIAFYQALPLYPVQEAHRARAAEGLRSNMRAVFEAVAHRNPYPAEQLDQGAWNQMVLKALFVGSRLAPIHALDARANAELTEMLCDYARERWSASRPVSPELWRCVALRASNDALECLARALASTDPREQAGAALALACSDDPAARELLLTAPDCLRERISGGRLRWQDLG